MTVFSRLLGRSGTSTQPSAEQAVAEALDLAVLPVEARAVLAPAVLTMASDGRATEAEMALLQNLCAFSPIFARLPEGAVLALIERILADLQEAGAEPVIENCAEVLPMELRETAFCFAMRVAMVDGVLAHALDEERLVRPHPGAQEDGEEALGADAEADLLLDVPAG
ncbi:MAG: tellurite resistance TerB family protein, partial [Pseudomonadota bacterium]|nr:tellurite resistance TerB family protein [Pseudomonadota bacterium]